MSTNIKYFVSGTACCGKSTIIKQLTTFVPNGEGGGDFEEHSKLWPALRRKKEECTIAGIYSIYLANKAKPGTIQDRHPLDNLLYDRLQQLDLSKFDTDQYEFENYVYGSKPLMKFVNALVSCRSMLKVIMENWRGCVVIYRGNLDVIVERMQKRKNGLDKYHRNYVIAQNIFFTELAIQMKTPIIELWENDFTSLLQNITFQLFMSKTTLSPDNKYFISGVTCCGKTTYIQNKLTLGVPIVLSDFTEHVQQYPVFGEKNTHSSLSVLYSAFLSSVSKMGHLHDRCVFDNFIIEYINRAIKSEEAAVAAEIEEEFRHHLLNSRKVIRDMIAREGWFGCIVLYETDPFDSAILERMAKRNNNINDHLYTEREIVIETKFFSIFADMIGIPKVVLRGDNFDAFYADIDKILF